MPIARPSAARFVALTLPLAALALAACGDSTDPGVDPLDGLDELAIYAAMDERVRLLDPTAEANQNLRQAVGWPAGPYEPALFGGTLAFQPGAGWATAQDRPAVPADVARVIWYLFSGASVAVPLSERGHIDLTDRPGGATTRVGVRIVSAAAGALADYDLRVGQTEVASARTRLIEVTGGIGNGTRQLQLTASEQAIENLATGDQGSVYALSLAEGGFNYTASLDADSVAATQVSSLAFDGTVQYDGTSVRLQLDVEEGPGTGLSGSGGLFLGGTRIADLVVQGGERSFSRPGGQSFTAAQQVRLGILVDILLTPAVRVRTYFS